MCRYRVVCWARAAADNGAVMKSLGISIMLVVAVTVVGCGQFDEVASFRMVNDGNAPVVVYQCGNTCGQRHGTASLRPGVEMPFNATVGGPPEYFLVTDTNRHLAGCLTVLLRHAPHGDPVVPTSSAAPCSRHLLSHGNAWDRTFG
jgi:hypothetical protein